jgi:hypothetical protein
MAQDQAPLLSRGTQELALSGILDFGVFCMTPEKVYFSNTSPEWP